MKKLLLLLLICSLPLCAQEPPTKFKKGKAYVMAMGNGIYQSSITGKSGFTSTAKLKMKAYNKGVEFANEKGAKLEVIGYETVEQSFMVFPQAIMSFRLVHNSVEINDPNDPNTITVTLTVVDIEQNNISVFPNPAVDRIYIHAPNMIQAVLYDIGGRVLRATNKNQINLSFFGTGNFVLKVIDQDNQTHSFKIIKQ